MQLNIKKNSQYHTLWKKCKSKWQEGISSHTSEWPSWKILQITNAGNSVNKRETSYTAGGEVNWRATTENICKLLKKKTYQMVPNPTLQCISEENANSKWQMQPSFNDTYNTWKWKRSRSVMSDSLLPNGHQALPSMGFSRQEYWSGLQYLNIHIIKVPMDWWVKTMQYIYGREYYWARKQDAVMTFAATEMDLEMILRSDAFHSEKDKHPMMWLMRCAVLSCFSRVPFFATPWTVVHQAPLSMGFSRQEY